MAKVTLVIATAPKPLPAGLSFSGKYLFKITGPSGGDSAQIVETATCVFDGVADGSYSASCTSLDASGAPMNDAVSCSFDVQTPAGAGTPPAAPAPAPAPDTYDAPASLAATVSY
jgi:hypothetical protein